MGISEPLVVTHSNIEKLSNIISVIFPQGVTGLLLFHHKMPKLSWTCLLKAPRCWGQSKEVTMCCQPPDLAFHCVSNTKGYRMYICLCICKSFPEQTLLARYVCLHAQNFNFLGFYYHHQLLCSSRGWRGLIYSPTPLAGYCISTGAAVINIFGWRTVSNSVGNTKQS